MTLGKGGVGLGLYVTGRSKKGFVAFLFLSQSYINVEMLHASRKAKYGTKTVDKKGLGVSS